MGRMADLRWGIADRIRGYADIQVYAFIPDAMSVPCVFIEPGRPFLDYQAAFNGAGARWRFLVTVLTNRMDEESAQEALDFYLDPEGPIVAALHRDDPGPPHLDVLDRIAQVVQVVSASRYGSYKVGGTHYYGVQITVEVLA